MKILIAFTASFLFIFATSARAGDAKANWDANCAQCHGKDGKADTKMGKTLNAKDLTDSKAQASFTDAQAAEAIKNGEKKNGTQRIKAFGGKLSDDDIKQLVAYVRTLKK